ncbi:MAG: RND family efflux transporter MFP subunit [Bacteroidia bacterium]|jgi:RND family efflux transporter MFP subunit
MKTTIYINLFTGVIATTFLLSSCGAEQNVQGSANSEVNSSSKTQSVEVVKPTQRSFTAEVLITGTAQPNQKVTLYAMESGYIDRMYKDIGDVVTKGSVVAQLINPDLNRQFEEKKAQLNAKKSTYDRLAAIYKNTPAITPLQTVENAEAEYLTAKAALNTVQDRLNFLSVKAPFSGIITRRMVDKGALIQSGLTEDNPQGIVELQDISPIRLTVSLPESDIGSISKGMEVNVTFPELSGESYIAHVSRTAGALDPASKTMQVEIDLKNPKGVIKPGMYAKALMQIGSRNGVVSLPVTAQWIYQKQAFVLIVKDNKVEKVPLKKGLANKDYFEVLNPEITENTLVIVQGKGLVQPGQIVKPVIKSE